MNMKLTIGMPTLYDYSGVVFTVQNLLEKLEDEWENFEQEVEILVVDNTPSKKYREDLAKQIKEINKPYVRYMEFLAERGPAEVKNQVIHNANGDYTLCIDCHIIIKKGVFKRLKTFLQELEGDKVLNYYTGPLVNNAGSKFTNFEPVWRHQMWGTWASDKEILNQDDPQPIWGQGCGLFLIKTDEWLGFNKNFKGFGAEEGYIHEKYRKEGREVLCIPWLLWWHRFGNPDAKHYNLSIFSKVRNYVLGFQELGKDLTPIYNHFVSLEHPGQTLDEHLIKEHAVDAETLKNLNEDQKVAMHKQQKLSETVWVPLTDDPVNYDSPKEETIGQVYIDALQDNENYLRDFYETLTKYASQCGSVLNVTPNKYSTIALAGSSCPRVYSFNYDNAPVQNLRATTRIVRFDTFEDIVNQLKSIDSIDMIVLQFPKNYSYVSSVLSMAAQKANKYVVVLGSILTSPMSSVNLGIKEFSESNSKWFLHWHNQGSVGMSIFSQTEPEKKVIAWFPDDGPGTELKKLLKKIGIVATPNCSCNARANMMNFNGIEWCEKNIDTIVGWLREEATKRKLPFVDLAGRVLVKRAIKRAKKNA